MKNQERNRTSDEDQPHEDDELRNGPSVDRPNYDYTSGGRARDWNRRGDDWGGQTQKGDD